MESAPSCTNIALICISEGGDQPPLALTPIFGQPYLHHRIKSLQQIGIKQFFIGVTAVSTQLLAYVDMAKADGIDVSLVRDPAEVTAAVAPNTHILVLCSDHEWSDARITEALATKKPLIAAVDERAENRHFERIDLNNRWAGLAILEAAHLASNETLPEGWDMASSLLRKALQAQVALWRVRQQDVQAGDIARDLDERTLLSRSIKQVCDSHNDPLQTLDSGLLGPVATRALPLVWLNRWSRHAVEAVPPIAALLSSALAYLGYGIGALATAAVALSASYIRKLTRVAEHRSSLDSLSFLTSALLAAALAFLLYQSGELPIEAGFLTALVFGGVAVLRKRQPGGIALLSPLAVVTILLLGDMSASSGFLLRALLVAQLALLLLPLKAKLT